MPGFIFGDVNAPDELALTQYCAAEFAHPITILFENAEGMPDAVPRT